MIMLRAFGRGFRVGTEMDDLWTAACSGDNEGIEQYFKAGGEKNVRYPKFGIEHSLIMGALRNGHYGTVRVLQGYGETIEDYEEEEYKSRIQSLREQYYAPEIEKLKGTPLTLKMDIDGKKGIVTSPDFPGFKAETVVGVDNACYELCEWLRVHPGVERVKQYLQINPAIPDFIYVGCKKIHYDPVAMPEPYEIYAIVSGDVGHVLEQYQEGKSRFYRIDVDEACRILTTRGYRLAVCKPGMKIVLDEMRNDPDPIEAGSTGVIKGLDGADDVLVAWDNGRTLNLIPFVDRWHQDCEN